MFITSGTAVVTKISYDFVAMTKAVAREDINGVPIVQTES